MAEPFGLFGAMAVTDLVRSGGRVVVAVLAAVAVVLAVAAVVPHLARSGRREPTTQRGPADRLAETFE